MSNFAFLAAELPTLREEVEKRHTGTAQFPFPTDLGSCPVLAEKIFRFLIS
jgi:hypothetical protein